MADLPDLSFAGAEAGGMRRAKRLDLAPAPTLSNLIWTARLGAPRPRLGLIHSVEAEAYEMAGVVPAEAREASSTTSFLRYQQYLSRRFVVCEGRDIVMTLHAKAIAAPGCGLVNEFNVGGAAGVPHDLLTHDFQSRDGQWWVDDRSVQRFGGFSIPLCHYGLGTFGHFILDALLQVFVFRRALVAGEARLLHWPLPQPWMLAALEACGVAPGARREVSRPVMLMEKAGLSSALAGHGVYFPSSLSLTFFDWLRAVFHAPVSAGKRRLYIRRSGVFGRAILNELELEAMVEGHGFEVIVPEAYPISDQMRLFAEAGTVISAWGSSLTLTPLLGGARRVVEILPASVTDAWFSRQAAVHKLDYRPFIEPADSAGNVTVDLTRLDRMLRTPP